jgi:hypothetical protein
LYEVYTFYHHTLTTDKSNVVTSNPKALQLVAGTQSVAFPTFMLPQQWNEENECH